MKQASLSDRFILAAIALGYHADTGLAYAKIANRFGISAMTAYRAITNQSWEHIK